MEMEIYKKFISCILTSTGQNIELKKVITMQINCGIHVVRLLIGLLTLSNCQVVNVFSS